MPVAYLYPEAVEAALADFVEAVGRRMFEAIQAAFAEMCGGVPSRHDVNQQQERPPYEVAQTGDASGSEVWSSRSP